MAAAQAGMSPGRGGGSGGRWVLAVSLRGSFRLRVQCLLPFGRLQRGKSFLDAQTIKERVWGGGEDGEGKHLLLDLATSAAAHLRHLLGREFRTGDIVLGASGYLQDGVWKPVRSAFDLWV